ncbi:MAG: DMT family transporter [Burkholderiales bacterium]|nr:DMT family transporter [Burkholderiales bacterium]
MVAIYNNQRAEVPVWSGAAWGMVYGTALSALIGLALGVEWTFDVRPMYIISLLYLSLFGTIAAFLCYLTLLKREGAGLASYVNVVTPVVALFLSTLFENYQWTVIAALGAVLAFVGNFLVMRRGR